MSVSYHLMRAINEKIKSINPRKPIDFNNDIIEYQSGYGQLYRSVMSSLTEWPLNVNNLININNWRFNRLITDDNKIRKPKAVLSMYVSPKENLILEWRPALPYRPYELEESDWLRWDDVWYAGRPPSNRILQLRCFGDYLYAKSYNKAEQELMEAIRGVIDLIKSFLKRYIDYEMNSDLYYDYDNHVGNDRKLLRIRLLNVKELEEEQKEQWLINTFDERLKVTAIEFLEIYKSSGLKYATTARILGNNISMNVTNEKVKSLIYKLYEEYPGVYDEVLKGYVPKGALQRKEGVVLPFIRT